MGDNMETETLTCTSCSKSWTRQRARGRKPKFCSDCSLVAIQSESQDQIVEPVKTRAVNTKKAPPTLYPAPSKWLCQACNTKIEIGVNVNEPPMHKCVKRANRILQLSLI